MLFLVGSDASDIENLKGIGVVATNADVLKHAEANQAVLRVVSTENGEFRADRNATEEFGFTADVHGAFGNDARDNELRAEMIGIRVKRYRWYAFVISGTFCGLSGGVWSFVNGHITPEISNWVFSGEIVYMVLLGGFMIFEGPIIGALLFTYLRLYAVATTEYWMLILGATLIFLVLVLPGGVTGGLFSLFSRLKPKRAS